MKKYNCFFISCAPDPVLFVLQSIMDVSVLLLPEDQIQAESMATSAVSLLSNAATSGPSTSHQATPSQSQLAGRKRKRKSRWSDAPSSDDAVITQAMASFSEPQQLSKEQEMQLQEQLEVCSFITH